MTVVAAGAGIAFAVALALLSAFFATGDARLDRIAERAFVAFSILAVPTILAVANRLPDGSLLAPVVTATGVVGVVGLGLAELLTTLGRVDFRRIAPAATLAFLAFLVWIGAVSIVAAATGRLPVALGWLGIGSIGAAAILLALMMRTPGVLRGEREPSRALAVAFGLPMAGIVGWMLGLATVL